MGMNIYLSLYVLFLQAIIVQGKEAEEPKYTIHLIPHSHQVLYIYIYIYS